MTIESYCETKRNDVEKTKETSNERFEKRRRGADNFYRRRVFNRISGSNVTLLARDIVSCPCSRVVSFLSFFFSFFFFFSLALPFVGIPQRYARNRRVRRGDRKLIACTAIDPLIISLRRSRERLLPLTRKSHRPRSNVPMLFPRLRASFHFYISLFFFLFFFPFMFFFRLFE